ncbi:MAG: hypothetical protein UV73_C0001G0234 [Candidatus Gottesmanbacteria bacterium GW2011_GWA2_43_14]|uniref:Uncharacterized protein n=1 Tax=Candidatus Gottesmanbacteria bacterium GW2011_GWA2_43_14 TaxID=1618443 RepID=A0A0G1GIX1_9BACT|nr:MAG: hypothetical protein UV73_C0001G0234 [Candidatus Gottesmanbacteria bacterium GW2011_GWA2_43_14]
MARKFIEEYASMDLFGVRHNCPYWSNKITGGFVTVRGFLNGKGEASAIRKELLKLLSQTENSRIIASNADKVRRLAKQNRLGIDCSGFVYRVWNLLIANKYGNTADPKMEEIFPGGINRTNADKLTSGSACLKIERIEDIRFGDNLRLNGGRHVALISEVNADNIVYAHASSQLTEIQGVHYGEIKIIKPGKDLSEQRWLEKARAGGNLNKYFKPVRGDGVFRLKILN